MDISMLIIEILTFVVGLISAIVGMKSDTKPTVSIDRHIHIYQPSATMSKTNLTTRTRMSNGSDGYWLAMFFLIIFSVFLYGCFQSTLVLIVAILSLLLCMLSLYLQTRYWISAKEALRTLLIVSQPFLHQILACFYIRCFDLEPLIKEFSEISTLTDTTAAFIMNLIDRRIVYFGIFCLVTIAVYAFQIVALVSLLARLYTLCFDDSPLFILKLSTSLVVVVPFCINIGFAVFFAIYSPQFHK